MSGQFLGPIRQRRGKGNSTAPTSPPVAGDAADSPDPNVQIDAGVAQQVNRWTQKPSGLQPLHRTINDHYEQLGREKFIDIARKVLGRKPGRETINRWRRQDRIPDTTLARRIRREAEIDRLGGTRAAARKLGVSPSTVRRYARGQTQSLRSQRAKDAIRQPDVDEAAEAAGLDNHAQPTIRLKGDFSIVTATSEYPLPTRDITMHPGNTTMSDDLIAELFDAYLAEDEYRLTRALETALTVDYFGANYDGFQSYEETNRVRIDHLTVFRIDWESFDVD